ncbi:MAG TPA: hypothetical protein VHF22_12230 [Planctomycetota bacterium]|nr:hypothetical protein [Planctomycetota bacterium]
MQGYTHVVAGALIQAGARRVARPPALVLALVAVAGVASHVLLDALSVGTYHPAHAPPGDPFWLAYHAVAYALMVYLMVKLRRFWVGFSFALLPDLDWIQRELCKVAGRAPLWRPGALHDFFASLPGLAQLDHLIRTRLPSWQELPWACVTELAVGLAAAIYVARVKPPERREL